jgi:hypothetical protein
MPDKSDDAEAVEAGEMVFVASCHSAPEEIFLLDVLEEAGIPATTRDDNLHSLGRGSGNSRILVPRKFKTQAEGAIEKARAEAEQRSVEQSFDADSIADSTRDVQKDPVLAEMFLLREAGPGKDQRLEGFVAASLVQGASAREIAKYLAAAGLSLEQADALVRRIAAEKEEQIRKSRGEQRALGKRLVWFALVLMALSAFPSGISGMVIIPLGLFLAGVTMIHFSSRPIPNFKPGDSAS